MSIAAPCKVRNWTDQPAFLEEGAERATFWDGDSRSGQVIEHDGMYYVSVGNLFGSQTVRVPSAEEALTVIGWVTKLSYEKKAEKRTPAASKVKEEHPTWEFLIDGEWQ